MVVPSAPVREEKTGDEIEIPRLSPAAVVQIREPLEPRLRETWDADVAPIRPGQTGVSSVDSNEPRIQVHIGQIELRVHKRDPARRVSPQRAKPRLDEFALARKYLDRIY